MTDNDNDALLKIAADCGCFGTSGNPSWRLMLSLIARGMIKVKSPIKKELYVNFKKPPTWWAPDADWAMDADYVAARYKASIGDLVVKGFFALPGNRLQGDWKAWKKSSSATPPAAADDESFRRNLERNLERSAIPEPDWFVRSPVGAAVMLLEEAMVASKMEADEIVAHGLQVINHNGQRLVTGPAGSDWDFNALCPP